MFDGLRLVSLAQEACAQRGLDAAQHLAIVRYGRVATFILKRSPFSQDEVRRLQRVRIVNLRLGTLQPGAWRDLTAAELKGLLPDL